MSHSLDEFLAAAAADCIANRPAPRWTEYGVLRRTPAIEGEPGPYLRDATRDEYLTAIARGMRPMVATVGGRIETVTLDLDHARHDLAQDLRRAHLWLVAAHGRGAERSAAVRDLRACLAEPDEPERRARAASVVLELEAAAAQTRLFDE